MTLPKKREVRPTIKELKLTCKSIKAAHKRDSVPAFLKNKDAVLDMAGHIEYIVRIYEKTMKNLQAG